MDFFDYLRIIRYRRWVIIISFSLVLITTLLFANFQKVDYRAGTTLVIEEPIMQSFFTGMTSNNMPVIFYKSIDTRLEEIRSTVFINNLQEYLKSQGTPIGIEELSGRVFAVPRAGNANIINIMAESNRPEKAVLIANAAAQEYVKWDEENYKKNINLARDFLVEQVSKAKDNLAKAEVEFRQYKERSNLYDFDMQNTHSINALMDLDIEKQRNNIDLAGKEGKIGEIHKQMGRSALIIPSVQDSIQVRKIRDEITTLQLKRLELLSSYSEKHPEVLDIDRKIKELRNKLEEPQLSYLARTLPENVISRNQAEFLIETRTDIEVLKSKDKAIDMLKKEREKSLLNITDKNIEFTRLKRSMDTALRMYNLFLDKQAEISVQASLQGGNTKIIEYAESAYQMQKPITNALGFVVIMAALVSFGLAYLFEYLDTSIRTSYDVKKYLDLPTLRVIPFVPEEDKRLLTQLGIKSSLAETYNALSFQIEYVGLKPPESKTLLVTSAIPKEGKSTISANIAISIAKRGAKVVLVDADLRRPTQHKLFNIDNSIGLSSILTGELFAEEVLSGLDDQEKKSPESAQAIIIEKCLQGTAVPGLKVLTSGPIPMNPIELIKSERMKNLISVLKQNNDIVIFDGSAAISVIDPIILSSLLDMVVMVIEAGRVNRYEAIRVKRYFSDINSKFIGTILNHAKPEIEKEYYYYSYQYSYEETGKKKRK